MFDSYEEFVRSKRRAEVATGHTPGQLNENLFDFQHAIVTWAVRRGRAAIFADTGLGKTLMQLAWADEVATHTGGKVLVLAPLAVSEQTIEQGSAFGIEVRRVENGQTDGAGVYITNYERIGAIDFSDLHGLVLDESSILKSHDGKTRTAIIDAAQGIPYRLSCTATPSPNDFEELGNQCEFLGVMNRTEMLATYFVNDTGDTGTWRLKGWGASKFWEWMGTWAVVLRNPADLGFDGARYNLTPLEYREHVVQTDVQDGDLFGRPAMGLAERRKAQRDSVEARCKALAEVVNADASEPWIIWCHLNDEAELLEKLIPRAVNVQGSDKDEFKTDAVAWFTGKKCVCQDVRFASKLAACHGNQNTPLLEKQNINPIPLSGNVEKLKVEHPKKTANTCASTSQKTPTKAKNPKPSETGGLDTNTESAQRNLSKCLQTKGVGVQSVGTYPKANGVPDSVLTTAINQAPSGGFFVPTATMESDISETSLSGLKQRQCTCGAAKNNQVLVAKARMFGYGLNMQHCARMAFVGLDDSFEKFYQAVRRCYRFGQKRSVHVHIFTAENEGQILANLKRKEQMHHEISSNMVEHMKDIMSTELNGTQNIVDEYREDTKTGDGWTVHLGDCVKWAKRMEADSIDYSVFSPPFADLFVYSNSDHDMGNCKDDEEFAAQLRYLIAELYRVLKPGRNVSFHCMNLPTTKMRQGFIGIRDFRGTLIRAFQEAGFIYHSEVCIWKDPVTAMQRTKALGLLHKTIRENAAMSRNGLPDYVVTMRKPGEQAERITHGEDLPVSLWQKYASPVWFDIDQGRTLNRMPARDENDEKHMCPLQLDVIERCIHLWSNPGDLVLSPFTGIGSEGYCAVKMGRRFVGTELKPQYWELACANIDDAKKEQAGLF